jgi:large repetitive protein
MRSSLLIAASLLLLIGCPAPVDDDDATVDDDDVTADDDDSVDDDDSAAVDGDGDGWTVDEDCDDGDPAVFPGAEEVCNSVDDDCDDAIDEDATDAAAWYPDADADSYGDDAATTWACEEPDDHVAVGGDCDDADSDVFPGADELCDGADEDCDGVIDEDDALDAPTWYGDADGDGYGVDSDVATACDAPFGYVAHDGDCDDADPAFHPGAAEADCTDPADYNCDGAVGYADGDGDGFAACEDCDDGEAAANPDGVEVCDALDNDCNGLLNDDATDAPTWYADADLDGHAGTNLTLVQCDAPAGYLAVADDCDDLDATSFPGATELCDEADNNCDGAIDEGVGQTWYLDADGDGYGNPAATLVACFAPPGTVGNADDCDDAVATTNPASWEICDGFDNDCDGFVDEDDAINGDVWFLDGDLDGYGVTSATTLACDQPQGFAGNADDCDDSDPGINPDAVELCNTWDDDCDGLVDEEDAVDMATWYQDADIDGFGNPVFLVDACDQPFGFVGNDDDCDDLDPFSTDVNIDGDCDQVLTADDCDDTDPASTIVAEDGDCDGTLFDDDCDDGDPSSTIVAEDGDCDGTLFDDDCDDADPSSTIVAEDEDCDTWLAADDCGPTDEAIYPGAPETPSDGIDSNCDGFDDPQEYSGEVVMPEAGTVNGWSAGYWSALNNGGLTVTRVTLTQACVNPQLALYQHASSDTSIRGSYYVMDAGGTIMDFTPFETYSGCNDCWLPHPDRLAVTMSVGTWWIAFQNDSGDMSGPSVYEDASARTVGPVTFDSPRAITAAAMVRQLPPPANAVSWQNRWRIDCE